jgi:UDP-glucose 4-epimerase
MALTESRLRVLVTGSSGRVGAAVARLLAREHAVVGLDRLPGPQTTLVGRIEDPDAVARAMQGVDAVVHTASLHAPHVGMVDDAEFIKVNVTGTLVLLDAAARQGVRRLVYTSTTSVYGQALVPRDRAVWVTEELEPLPRDIYDQTKLEAEALCRAAAATGALTCVVLRMSRCFPEPRHLMAAYRLYRGVDLEDVASAHAQAIVYNGPTFDVFNISARSPFAEADCTALLADAATLIHSRYPAIAAAFASRDWPLPASIDRVYVIDEALQRLGYAPRGDLFSLAAATGRAAETAAS